MSPWHAAPLLGLAAAVLLAAHHSDTAHAWMYDVFGCSIDKERMQIEKRSNGRLYCVSNDTHYELVKRGWGKSTFPGHEVLLEYTVVTEDRSESFRHTDHALDFATDRFINESIDRCMIGIAYSHRGWPPAYFEDCVLTWYNDTAKQAITPIS